MSHPMDGSSVTVSNAWSDATGAKTVADELVGLRGYVLFVDDRGKSALVSFTDGEEAWVPVYRLEQGWVKK